MTLGEETEFEMGSHNSWPLRLENITRPELLRLEKITQPEVSKKFNQLHVVHDHKWLHLSYRFPDYRRLHPWNRLPGLMEEPGKGMPHPRHPYDDPHETDIKHNTLGP